MWTDNPERAHQRYVQQAGWSRSFREYLYKKLPGKDRITVLEVGCGTGAVLECVRNEFQGDIGILCGVDRDRKAMKFDEAKKAGQLLEGTAERLPFSNGSFDFVFCHYLLLWVRDPLAVLLEMRRVTAENGICAALAEPCYDEMRVEPDRLLALAEKQRRALVLRGVDPGIGSRLGELFRSAGFEHTEWGSYQRQDMSAAELRDELLLMKQDAGLTDFVLDPAAKMKYDVPTYFAYAVKEN